MSVMGRPYRGGGGRGRGGVAVSAPARRKGPQNGEASAGRGSERISSPGVEESFQLLPVRGNGQKPFFMSVKLTEELLALLLGAEEQGITPQIKFGSNAAGNVIKVGDDEFRFSSFEEVKDGVDLCDLYEEDPDGEGGNGVLVAAGPVKRKLMVQRKLTTQAKDRVKQRTIEAHVQQKSRKSMMLEHSNSSLKKESAAPSIKGNGRAAATRLKEPAAKKRRVGNGGPLLNRPGPRATTPATQTGKPEEVLPPQRPPLAVVTPPSQPQVSQPLVSVPAAPAGPTSPPEVVSSPGDSAARKAGPPAKPAELRLALIKILAKADSPIQKVEKDLQAALPDVSLPTRKELRDFLKKIAQLRAPGLYVLNKDLATALIEGKLDNAPNQSNESPATRDSPPTEAPGDQNIPAGNTSRMTSAHESQAVAQSVLAAQVSSLDDASAQEEYQQENRSGLQKDAIGLGTAAGAMGEETTQGGHSHRRHHAEVVEEQGLQKAGSLRKSKSLKKGVAGKEVEGAVNGSGGGLTRGDQGHEGSDSGSESSGSGSSSSGSGSSSSSGSESGSGSGSDSESEATSGESAGGSHMDADLDIDIVDDPNEAGTSGARPTEVTTGGVEVERIEMDEEEPPAPTSSGRVEVEEARQGVPMQVEIERLAFGDEDDGETIARPPLEVERIDEDEELRPATEAESGHETSSKRGEAIDADGGKSADSLGRKGTSADNLESEIGPKVDGTKAADADAREGCKEVVNGTRKDGKERANSQEEVDLSLRKEQGSTHREPPLGQVRKKEVVKRAGAGSAEPGDVSPSKLARPVEMSRFEEARKANPSLTRSPAPTDQTKSPVVAREGAGKSASQGAESGARDSSLHVEAHKDKLGSKGVKKVGQKSCLQENSSRKGLTAPDADSKQGKSLLPQRDIESTRHDRHKGDGAGTARGVPCKELEPVGVASNLRGVLSDGGGKASPDLKSRSLQEAAKLRLEAAERANRVKESRSKLAGAVKPSEEKPAHSAKSRPQLDKGASEGAEKVKLKAAEKPAGDGGLKRKTAEQEAFKRPANPAKAAVFPGAANKGLPLSKKPKQQVENGRVTEGDRNPAKGVDVSPARDAGPRKEKGGVQVARKETVLRKKGVEGDERPKVVKKAVVGKAGARPPSGKAKRAEQDWFAPYEKAKAAVKGPISSETSWEEYQAEYREKHSVYMKLYMVLENDRAEFIDLGKKMDAAKKRGDAKEVAKVCEKLQQDYKKTRPRFKRMKQAFYILHDELAALKGQLKKWTDGRAQPSPANRR